MAALHSITDYTPDPTCPHHDLEGLVCEDHPDRPWIAGVGRAGVESCCGAPGVPCRCVRWSCGAVGPRCGCVDHDAVRAIDHL